MPATETLIYAGYISIVLLSLWGLWCDRLPFSLNKLFWLFCLVFFGISPMMQFAWHTFPFHWTHNQENLKSFLATNNVVLCAMMVYGIIRLAVWKRVQRQPPNQLPPGTDGLSRAGIFVLFAALLMQILISPNLLVRQAVDAPGLIRNQSLQLLADKAVKGIVLCGMLSLLAGYRKGTVKAGLLSGAVILTVIANMPTAVPRYWLACLYLGVAITCCVRLLVLRARLFETLLFSGLVIIFPLLSLIRQTPASQHPSGNIMLQAFCSQDFDAYASLRNTILYTETHGMLHGKQIGTTLMFFVPRSVWPAKSIGSGAIVNPPRPGSDFNNYCSPLPAEGYLDFGFTGALLWIAVCALFAGWYDRYYWLSYKKPNSFARAFYPACLGLFFFTLRGDLLSSFAYSTGIAASGYIFYILFVLRDQEGR
ncbi:MAG: hypothetical protein QM743_10665 [Chitinophagaceae bacterium]